MDAIARTFHSTPAVADLQPAAAHDELAPVFLEAGAALAAAGNPDEVGRAVWDCVRISMPASSCVLYLTDAAGEALCAVFAAGEHADTLSRITVPLGHGLSGWVATNRCTMVNADALLDFAGLAVALDPPLHTSLSSPIASDASTLGTLTLYSSATSAFSDRHGRLLEALAARAALALGRLHSRAA